MRKTLLAIALLCTACVAQPTVYKTELPLEDPTPLPTLETLGGYPFDVVTPEHIRAIAEATSRPRQTLSSHDFQIRAGYDYVIPLTSGNENYAWSFPPLFADAPGVASVKSATLPRATEDVAGYVEGVVRPLLKAWMADATLLTSYTIPPRSGPGIPAYPEPTPPPEDYATEAGIVRLVGWPVAYRSELKREVLYVFGDAGVAVKIRWAPKQFSEGTVRVTMDQAIAIHEAAMRDPASTSQEARTGRDAFLGSLFVGVLPPIVNGNAGTVSPVTDYDAGVVWLARLDETYAGRPAWWVHSENRLGMGVGIIDALTGAELRFMRPNRNNGTAPSGPYPSATPLATPAP